jgi:flavin-dependent dehydrogenase
MWPLIEEIRRKHYPNNKIMKKWAAPIPSIFEPTYFDQPVSGDGFALIGDAAGHVDALSGEGIFYAIWGGRLLAGALIEGKPTQYEEAWRGEYGRELRKTSEMFGKFYNPKMIERFLWVASRSAAMREFFRAIMTDEPSYFTLRKMFVRRLPRIAFDLLRSFW